MESKCSRERNAERRPRGEGGRDTGIRGANRDTGRYGGGDDERGSTADSRSNSQILKRPRERERTASNSAAEFNAPRPRFAPRFCALRKRDQEHGTDEFGGERRAQGGGSLQATCLGIRHASLIERRAGVVPATRIGNLHFPKCREMERGAIQQFFDFRGCEGRMNREDHRFVAFILLPLRILLKGNIDWR